MKTPCVLIVILLSCLGAESFGQVPTQTARPREWRDLIGTGLTDKDCQPTVDDKDKGARICKGVEGYSLLVRGDNLKPEIYLMAPGEKRYQIQYWDTKDPGYRRLHPSVTWVVVHTPRKTIAVDFTVFIEPKEDYSFWGSYDIIGRIVPGTVCIVGSVPASSTSAGESIGIASSPSRRPCLGLNEREKRDWFATARRLASEGKVREAELALPRVREPSERFIVYREISNAQFKAGDSEAARSTLKRARVEALKTRTLALEHSLGQVCERSDRSRILQRSKIRH